MGDVAVCTVVSKNYLAYARVLAESLVRHHPEIPIFVLLVDRLDGYFDPKGETFTLLTAEDLPNIASIPSFFFKYTILELNTAVKPFFFEYLIETHGLRKLIYFDPDICIFSSLQRILDLLETNTAVVTPHLLEPIEDDLKLTEADILQAGTFNLGFLGLSANAMGRAFLKWWQKRLYDLCIVDHEHGYFVDQKWVDLAPGLFPSFYVLIDARYNAAYWNFHERGRFIHLKSPEEACLNDEPLVFFHFSGFNADNLERISKHQNRFTLTDLPNLRPLYEMYRDRLLAHRHEETRHWPYAYGVFDNGIRIPDLARQLYREMPDAANRFPAPFSAGVPGGYYQWLTEPAKHPQAAYRHLPGLPRLWWELYKTSPELQQAFPDPFGGQRAAFYQWISTGGRELYPDVADIFLPSSEDIEKASGAAISASGTMLPGYQGRVPANLRRLIGAPLKVALRRSNPELLNRLYFWALGQKRSLLSPGSARRRLVGAASLSDTAGAESSLPFGVNVAGYLAGDFGIAQATRSLVHALESAAVPMALNNIVVDNKRYEDKTFQEFTEDNPYSVNLLAVNADMVGHTAAQKGAKWFENRYNIGVWYWELSGFPPSLWDAFAPLQEIWVTSAFCAEAISRVSPIPVVKITYPLHLDEAAVHANRSKFKIPEDKFTLVFSFDFHSYMERKNPLAVIEAFRRAFSDREDALLVLKSINAEQYPEKRAVMKEAARGLNIHFIDEYLTHVETLSLFAVCDCLVSLHRAEGLGLGMAEAMYLGKPVIATGYSGNMDFMDINNSLPVRYHLVELTEDCGPYLKGNVWAEPDVDHAAELMRSLYEDRAFAARIGERAASDMRARHDPKIAGQQMRARLERIAFL